MEMTLFLAFWICSAALCLYIGKKRHIRVNFWWQLAFAFLGPLLIPFLLVSGNPKPKSS